MSLVIEDGSIVDGANSYVSRADYITYAATVGVTINSAVSADIELVKAANFIRSHEARLKGNLTDRDQPLSYPRENLVIEGFSWDSSEIPRQVILCQMALALDVHAGIDLYNPPANANRATKSERVEGAIEVEYFGSNSGAKMGRTSTAQALLASLMVNSGLFSIPLVRV